MKVNVEVRVRAALFKVVVFVVEYWKSRGGGIARGWAACYLTNR